MSDQDAETVTTINDLDVEKKVSITGAECIPSLKEASDPDAKSVSKKEKPKKVAKEKKAVVHGGGPGGGENLVHTLLLKVHLNCNLIFSDILFQRCSRLVRV